MTNNNIFVYVLRIVGSLLDGLDEDSEDYVIVTENKNLAINIALTKLVCAKAHLGSYQRYCRNRAIDFPTLSPMSYNNWLADAIIKDDLNGVTIEPKALVTDDNVKELVF